MNGMIDFYGVFVRLSTFSTFTGEPFGASPEPLLVQAIVLFLLKKPEYNGNEL